MGLFLRLFWLFENGKAHKDLQDAYSQLNSLAVLLSKNLEMLRQIQKELVLRNVRKAKYVKTPTRVLGLEKALFVEEELLKDLKKLAEVTEIKFVVSLKETRKIRPINPVEKEEISSILTFLETIKLQIPSFQGIQALSEKEKLNVVESCLRDITSLSKKFYEKKYILLTVPKKVEEESISNLLRTVYLSPEHHPSEQSLLLYRVTASELQSLEKEARKINNCNDPDYKIEWRRWWRNVQVFERDKKTPIKDPHINVTIKLFGRQKKDIHLLLK